MRVKVTTRMGFTNSPTSADGCWRRSRFVELTTTDRAQAQRVADLMATDDGQTTAEVVE